MNKSMFMDAVGMVDADIVEAYVLKDMALRSRKRSKTILFSLSSYNSFCIFLIGCQ